MAPVPPAIPSVTSSCRVARKGAAMPTVSRYTHGTPSWVDLATPDLDAARAFYGSLFGWQFDEQPAGDRGTYVMCSKGDATTAGMMQLSPEMAAGGMPPSWSSYVTVDDLDAAAERVGANGGQVMQPPMDVMDAGRMAVVADPAGAVICMWEPREHIGAGVVNEHGALIWNELVTPDTAVVTPFYAAVFGWSSQTMDMPTGPYTVFSTPDSQTGSAGVMPLPAPGMPTFWAVYFAVDDCAAAVATAREHGATVLAEPLQVEGVGTFATLVDPQGATFAVMQPAG